MWLFGSRAFTYVTFPRSRRYRLNSCYEYQHTISLPLSSPLTSRDIRTLFQDRYAGEPLVRISGEPPSVKNISGKHGVEVGGFGVHSAGRRVVVCVTIDNLLKGAATQALQNMNLALGYAEFEAIPVESGSR